MASQRVPVIAVVGSGSADDGLRSLASCVGRAVAERGAFLICGGLGGVMQAAASGAKLAGGFTIGYLPGDERQAANDSIDLVLPTGMGESRNLLIVRAADAVIALSGSHGTMSEIVFALLLGKPVVSLYPGWSFSPEIVHETDPDQAVTRALQLCRG